MVLAAYYAGTIVDLEPFMEDPALKNHYALGTSNGGQYLLVDSNYHGKSCGGREMVSLFARSITFSMDVWAKRNEVRSENLQKLCEMISVGGVPGFDTVQDICGADDPIVLYNEHAFINMNNPEFDERFERKNNLSAYVDWVAAGDHSKPFKPLMKPKTKEPADFPEDHLPSLEDTKVEANKKSENGAFGDLIDVYTRAQALADGVLVDVTKTAKEAGIVYPTAVTQGLWSEYIEVPESLKGLQDLEGRLWDVLTMFACSARAMKKANTDVVESQKDTAQTLYFKTLFQMPTKTGSPKMKTVDLKAICGPGDNAEPILTIMLVNES